MKESNEIKYVKKWYNYYRLGTISCLIGDIILSTLCLIMCFLDEKYAKEGGIYILVFVFLIFTFGFILGLFKCKKIKKDIENIYKQKEL